MGRRLRYGRGTGDNIGKTDNVGSRFHGELHLWSCLALDIHHELVQWIYFLLLDLSKRRDCLGLLLLEIHTSVLTHLQRIFRVPKFKPKVISGDWLGHRFWIVGNIRRLIGTHLPPFRLLLLHYRLRCGGIDVNWRRWWWFLHLLTFLAILIFEVEFQQSSPHLPHGYLPHSFLILDLGLNRRGIPRFLLP